MVEGFSIGGCRVSRLYRGPTKHISDAIAKSFIRNSGPRNTGLLYGIASERCVLWVALGPSVLGLTLTRPPIVSRTEFEPDSENHDTSIHMETYSSPNCPFKRPK